MNNFASAGYVGHDPPEDRTEFMIYLNRGEKSDNSHSYSFPLPASLIRLNNPAEEWEAGVHSIAFANDVTNVSRHQYIFRIVTDVSSVLQVIVPATCISCIDDYVQHLKKHILQSLHLHSKNLNVTSSDNRIFFNRKTLSTINTCIFM